MAAPHTTKDAARAAAYAVRATCDPACGADLARHMLDAGIIPPGAVVAGFWPLPQEIDIRPLLHALANSNTLALPRTPPRGQPLTFHTWRPGDRLQPGRFGTQVPAGPPVTPTVVLVPLLAFDACGNRLGYGGGYYDRTLAALPRALAIGCAFAAQQSPAIPTEPHDIPLAALATEHGVTRFARPPCASSF